jgi:lipoyl-dependent peroxiredoxin
MALSFALAGAGYSAGTLETKAAVTLDKDGAGFRISKSALTLTAKIDGIDESEFARIAAEAKANCPISKLFDTEITLDHRLEN